MKTSSDYTVLATVAYSREHDMAFVTSWFRKRITTDEYMELLVPIIEDHDCSSTTVENVTYGQMFGQQLERKGQQVEFADAMQDKVARIVASGASNLVRKGKLRFLSGVEYLPELTNEAEFFPYGDHDDQVDVLAFIADFLKEIPDYVARKVKQPPTLMEVMDAQVEQASKNRGGKRRDPWSQMNRR